MRRWLAVLVTAGSVVSLPASGVAQDQDGWSLSVNPRVGYSVPDKPLGALAPGGPVVEMAPAVTAGATVELGTPWRWVGLRFTALNTFAAGLNRRVPAGSSSCGDGCIGLEYTSEPLKAGGSTLNLSMDLLAHLPLATDHVAPYLVAGAGLKRYDLGGGLHPADPRYRYGGRSAGLAVNVGGGLDVAFGNAVLTLEAVDYISGLNGRWNHEWSPLSERAFNTLRHDVVFSVGLEVDVFGW